MMSSNKIDLRKKRFNEINREIEILLVNNSYDENVKNLIMSEIIKEIRIISMKKLLKILLIIVFVVTQIYMIPFLNWNASAVGRIIMIKMLKVWDWRYLYSMDCLIKKNVKTDSGFDQDTFDSSDDECCFCENIDDIHHVWEISYVDLKSNYLYRGHPVVIEEPELNFHQINIHDYIDNLKNLTKLIDSNPCNLHTNLMTGAQLKNLNALLELAKKSSNNWFLHFRNCDFDAVKASRALVQQPYFFASHLKPFSSSWIIMSNDYKVKQPKKLLVKHLVVVKQIIGRMDVLIQPKTGCKDVCKDFLLQIEVGSSFVFSAEHWDFLYFPVDEGNSVTFIREYEWNI